MEAGGRRGGDGGQLEGGDHSEAAGACAPQRPEQVWFPVVVALDDAPVGQDDLGAEQLVRGGAVGPPQGPEPAAEGEPGDPHLRAGAARHGHAVPVELFVEAAERGAGAHPHRARGDRHRPQAADVDEHAAGGRVTGEAVPPLRMAWARP